MIRVSPILAAAAIAACTPSSREPAMQSANADRATTAQTSSEPGSASPASGVQPGTDPGGAGGAAGAAQGPMPQPVSAAENALPAAQADSAAEAEGRRTLSTAFVRLGPGGELTVELRDGRTLVLRNVVMRAKDYCGTQLAAGGKTAKFCGGYAEVAAARPGGAPSAQTPVSAAANPLPSAQE